MADDYIHGVKVIEAATGGRALSTVATAVILLVGDAPEADDAFFPANQLVLVTDIDAAIAKAGDTGSLKASLKAIANQASTVVIVGRADSEDPEDLEAAIIALITSARTAEAQLGVKPRILGAPGHDSQAVAVELALTGAKLRARAYARTIGATVAEVLAYRAAFNGRELMLIHGDFTSAGVVVNAVATAMGLRAKIDQTLGWNRTISNVPVSGVTGIANPLFFDLQDSATDVGVLNAAGVTCLVSLNGAFRFWGSRTCAPADSDFIFESAVATAQILADTCARGQAWAIDNPITPQLGRDLVEEVNTLFRRLKAGGYIIDAKAQIDPGSNTQETLAAGKLTISYEYTPTPPLEGLTLVQVITDKFLVDFAAQVAA